MTHATAEPNTEPTVEVVNETTDVVVAPESLCPHCEAPGFGEDVQWCLKCGFYPRMGFFVEVDPQEAAAGHKELAPWDPRRVALWVWVLVAGLVAITAMSITVRFMFPVGTLARPVWAISQWVLGGIIFAGAHLLAYLDAISDDSSLTLMDFLMRPLKSWSHTFHQLPATARRVCIGGWALTAAVMGPTVIGGIPYHMLWELGPEEQVGPNLVHAITAAAADVEGEEKPLQEAVQDFAGRPEDANPDEPELDKFAPENLPKRKHKIDCLIIGYKPEGPDSFSALVLAAAIDNKLQVIGSVSNEFIPPDVRNEMFAKLKLAKRDRPFIPTTIDAVWVEPKLTCRVGYNGMGASHRITEPVFQKQLGDVDVK